MGNEFLKMLSGGNSIEWNGARKMLHYHGDMYVILGIAFGGDLDASARGFFVLPRNEYATGKAITIQFIPGEFLVEVYPSLGIEDSDSSIQQSGCAADVDLDNASNDLSELIAGIKHPDLPLLSKSFQTFKNTGKYAYPELSEKGRVYLDIDINTAGVGALVDALQMGEPFEEAQKKATKAAKAARKKREFMFPEQFQKARKALEEKKKKLENLLNGEESDEEEEGED